MTDKPRCEVCDMNGATHVCSTCQRHLCADDTVFIADFMFCRACEKLLKIDLLKEKKYEYRRETVNDRVLIDKLNEFGAAGWQVVYLENHKSISYVPVDAESCRVIDSSFNIVILMREGA